MRLSRHSIQHIRQALLVRLKSGCQCTGGTAAISAACERAEKDEQASVSAAVVPKVERFSVASASPLPGQGLAQHSLFVQVDGTNELMRYLLMHISLSPTDYAPSGLSARMLAWAKEQQHEVDLVIVRMKDLFLLLLVVVVLLFIRRITEDMKEYQKTTMYYTICR